MQELRNGLASAAAALMRALFITGRPHQLLLFIVSVVAYIEGVALSSMTSCHVLGAT